ncbi:PREDICTED: complex I intermediate-associated protein 30, mitochondrial [Thamnophis sirtalis]|uniref:Complex I intermediate-associated protein 30, mitochondrial n=1 Tax=Thamnophis sirtalis TaxID=35019 RepID=A0A6I9XNN1_9SAUR|nr:PREDICTED: complex I intermediate-associated protein 30, mitochondrial [Thamnophis sirtalis]XP_032085266.1 complex I intermediate-associated protein 30, mitochondrial [Thamnophis elegans]
MASFLKTLDFLSLINKQYCQSSLCRTLANGHHARWYSGYQRPGTSIEKISPRKTIDNFKKVMEELKTQCGLVKKEAIDFMKDFDQKPVQDFILNQTKVVWEFRSEEDINKWVLGSDTAIGGKSEISIKLDKNKQYASVSGNLNTTVPHDGVTKYSGYCAMISKPEMLAFNRTKVHDWSNFNSLCLRVRGDGRPWMLNINPNKFDPTSVKDSYNYFIFPRGGPYWEEIEVPFSKFFFTSHGRIQDGQYAIWPDRISTLGLTLADKVDGPFQLDIDFIGLYSDQSHTETFAYELYEKNFKK